MSAAEIPMPEMPPLPGVRLATTESGTGYNGRPDMLLAALAPGSTVAGVLTRSSLPGAPVRWTRARLAEGAEPAALVVNAGNANVFTGSQGLTVVERTASRTGALLGCAPNQVLICSTGRIGKQLDPEAVETALGDLAAGLSDGGWHDAARTIMTTDRWPKLASRRARVGESEVELRGLAKGSTMIAPNMATTLDRPEPRRQQDL
jgi:glutamate N-acetyltransferase/amino-acid N-acetyltransferase